MLRILVILFCRAVNAVKRGKFTNNSRSCIYYGALSVALIYYNCILRSAINVSRGILSEEISLEDLLTDTSLPNVDYEEDPSEELTHHLPSAFIIGASRCGTTALTDFLGIHPDVQVVPKEIHYFDKFFENGMDWYKSNMPLCSKYQIVIEKCSSYYANDKVAERIFKARPDAKIILGVRDPIIRAFSEHSEMEKREGKGKFFKPFREFAFEQGNMAKMMSNWTVLTNSFYADFFKPWLKYFPLNKMFIYSAEELAANPAKIMRDLQIFLQLRLYVDESHFKTNATDGFPCIVDKGDPEKACLNESMQAAHFVRPPVEWGIFNHLKGFYKKHNEDFYNLTKRNFNWDVVQRMY